jgi:mycofactocin system transcriptional regulator
MTDTPGPEDQRRRAGRRPVTSRPDLERVAFALFAADGFDATSVEAIAGAAGIGRRTFFRYYPSKNDVVWGDFDTHLHRLRLWLDQTPAAVPVMEAVHRAVLEFNRIAPDQARLHRQRLGLILGVPTLLAHSTLRFAQWRAVVAGFAAGRLDLGADDLLPRVIAHSALGAAVAGYEAWLADDNADLGSLLDEALGELADGFRHHGRRR